VADILDAHPDLPTITWTVSWLGGVTGDVLGLGVPPEQAEDIFTAWRQALRLENVRETPVGHSRTSLPARSHSWSDEMP
jgi:hypothetical protein